MSVGYKSVTWTRAKLVYDAVLIIAVSCFLLGFQAMALRAGKTGTVTEEGSLAIRTFGALHQKSDAQALLAAEPSLREEMSRQPDLSEFSPD